MARFIHEDFLLDTRAARELYHDHAAGMPIIDYHCHLPPAQIAQDHRYANITQVWLYGDHYKWRAMRTNGVPEKFCSGDATDWEKFEKWAATVPYLLRNPLYSWTHLELARYFGVHKTLSPETAREVWNTCNARMSRPDFSARGLMEQSNVVLVCTTDDPTDTLEHHQAVAADPSFKVQVLPTWRPDKGMAVESPEAFNRWVDKLANLADVTIRDFDSFLEALSRRHAFFHQVGCRLSDHGIETAYAAEYTDRQIRAIFRNVRRGRAVSPAEAIQFKSAMLYEFGIMDHAKGWTQQFHLGALRNNNSLMFNRIGPDTGFDSIGDFEIARPLSRLLDRLNATEQLAKTILYNLNPRDNALMATLLGNFQDGSVPGKIQYGSAWWFLDQEDGMRRQIEDLSQLGLLSRFVGMLTDSRSFLSYTRHEYFRRILCSILGQDVESGRVPRDMKLLGRMVRDICYHNAAQYFGFNLPMPKGKAEKKGRR
jgi:glucuronate isomerase